MTEPTLNSLTYSKIKKRGGETHLYRYAKGYHHAAGDI